MSAETETEPGPLPAEARSELLDFWRRRAEGEWTTAAALQHVHDDLVEWGAPEALRALAKRCIDDECRHTRWCTERARSLGASDFNPRVLGERPFALQGASARENRLLRPLFAGCISETIAIHVLRESHAALAPGSVRQMNRQHMAEEVDHARLGWTFLAWLAEHGQLGHAERALLRRALPAMLSLAAESWRSGGRDVSPALQARGFIHSTQIERALKAALDEVILRGFADFEIDVDWQLESS